jgi:hypothetical protein
VPELVGLESEARRLEAKEGLLEMRPLRFDYTPCEAGGENALSHFGERAVVGKLAQRFGIGSGRQQAGERFGAAFPLLGSGADGFERDQVRRPLSQAED